MEDGGEVEDIGFWMEGVSLLGLSPLTQFNWSIQLDSMFVAVGVVQCMLSRCVWKSEWCISNSGL